MKDDVLCSIEIQKILFVVVDDDDGDVTDLHAVDVFAMIDCDDVVVAAGCAVADSRIRVVRVPDPFPCWTFDWGRYRTPSC
jgi:hypothetical protein